jgi:hypothetical protein
VRSRSNGVTNEIEDGWQIDEVYTEFPEAFNRVLHGLLKFKFSILFGGLFLSWIGSQALNCIKEIIAKREISY